MKRISEEDLILVLKHTEGLWDALRHKSIFITGATGFFGKWLLESFIYINRQLSLNASVTALSRNPDVFIEQHPFYKDEPSVSFIKGDIQNFDFPEANFDYIIHGATEADAKLNAENPVVMIDVIINGTKRVLEFAKKKSVKGFLLTSSGAVYGQQPAHVTHTTEEDNFTINFNDTLSGYAEGKRVAELYCSIYHKQFNIPVKVARCFAFLGPYLPLNKHFAIGNFVLNGLNNEDIIINGDGRAYRSYMYAADLTIWLWTILLRGKENVPYNVGSDRAVTIEETAAAVAGCFGNAIKYKILGQPSDPVHRYVPAINKAEKELGLTLTTELNEGIEKTRAFYESGKK